MKKIINLRELKEYYEQNKPDRIVFQTQNQEWYDISDPCKIEMVFPTMLIFDNPNIICLKCGQNTITFDRIDHVEIDADYTVLGTTINIFCGNSGSNKPDAVYTLIAK